VLVGQLYEKRIGIVQIYVLGIVLLNRSLLIRKYVATSCREGIYLIVVVVVVVILQGLEASEEL